MPDGRATSNRVRRVRLTLTHDDFNVLLAALGSDAEYIRDYQGAQDPYLADIQRVEDKLQAARERMR